MKTGAPAGYSGPSLEIMIRDMKTEPIPGFVKRVMDVVPAGVTKFGSFLKDKIDGDLSQAVMQYLEGERKASLVEMSTFLEEASKVKIDCEQNNMKVAGKFIEWTFKKIANEVENVIEEDKKVKHSYI